MLQKFRNIWILNEGRKRALVFAVLCILAVFNLEVFSGKPNRILPATPNVTLGIVLRFFFPLSEYTH